MADGLNTCLTKFPEWPPGAAQFRALCIGMQIDDDGNDASWQHAAIKRADSEREREKRLSLPETPESKDRRKAAGREAIESMKGLFSYSMGGDSDGE